MKISIKPAEPLIIPVIIKGGGKTREIDAIIDTGASYFVIPTEDAIDLGHDLAAAPRFPIIPANGIIEAPRIIIEEFCLGSFLRKKVAALCLDLAGDRVSALLGLNILQRFTIRISFKDSILEISDP